jgi:tetratricopeptide (TPR) repeat protein
VYYKQELQITQEAWGREHLECSRIYHELGRLADEACDYHLALQYLNQALAIEKLHLSQLKGERRHEVSRLCKGTQKLIGRIHFKTGDFNLALQASFAELV